MGIVQLYNHRVVCTCLLRNGERAVHTHARVRAFLQLAVLRCNGDREDNTAAVTKKRRKRRKCVRLSPKFDICVAQQSEQTLDGSNISCALLICKRRWRFALTIGQQQSRLLGVANQYCIVLKVGLQCP